MLLESLCQPIAIFHRSHSPVALRHCSSDAPNPGRCDKEVKIEICMFSIPVQQRHLKKIPEGEQSC